MNADFAAFEQAGPRAQGTRDIARRNAAGLDVAAVTNAAFEAFGRAGGFAARKTCYVGQLLSLVHGGAVVTHVVLQGHRGLVGPAIDEVAFADFVLAQAELPAAAADQAFQQIGGFRPACAAVSIDRGGVGEPGIDFHINLRTRVLAGQQSRVKNRRHGGRKGGQVGPHVGVGVHPHGQELAIGVHRHLGVADVVAAMRVGQKGLCAFTGPFDAAVDLFGGPGQCHVFGVQEDFGAEAATHVGRDHAHLVLGQAQNKGGHQQTFDVRVLIRHVERVFLGGAAVHANGAARLHGIGHQAVVGQVKLGDVGRLGKGRIDLALVANRPFVAMVVRRCLMQGRAFGGVAHIGHRAQHVITHIHRFGRVFGLLKRFGDHHRHLVTHVTRLADGQNRVRWLLHRRAVRAGDEPAARQAAHFPVDVLAGEDFNHAGHRLGFGQVNVFDDGVRVRAAHKHGIGLVGLGDVVGVVACAGQETVVFLAAKALPNVGKFGKIRCAHGVCSLCVCHAKLHGFDDVLITRAAAQVAFQQLADLALARLGVVRGQIHCAHHHAGGAKAALKAVAFLESRLHWVHGAVGFGQAFDGGDVRATGLRGQDVARLDGAPVHDDGAGAALGGVAADMGAGEFEVFAQGLHQQGVGGEVKAAGFAIDIELDLHRTALLVVCGWWNGRIIDLENVKTPRLNPW